MKRLMGMTLLAVVVSVLPAYAEGSASGKPLSSIAFSALPENHGVTARQLDRRYAEYRDGRYAVTTLDAANVR